MCVKIVVFLWVLMLIEAKKCVYEEQMDRCLCADDGVDIFLSCDDFPILTHSSAIALYTVSIFVSNLQYESPVAYASSYWPNLEEIYDNQNIRIPCHMGKCQLNLPTPVSTIQEPTIGLTTSQMNYPSTSSATKMDYTSTSTNTMIKLNGTQEHMEYIPTSSTSDNIISPVTSQKHMDFIHTTLISANTASTISTETNSSSVPLTSGITSNSTKSSLTPTNINVTQETVYFTTLQGNESFIPIFQTESCDNFYKIGFYIVLTIFLFCVLIILIYALCYICKQKRVNYAPSNQIEMEDL